MYVCIIFIRCDKRTSNNEHKKQSPNDVQYKSSKTKKKQFHLTKLYKERIRKDFLWRSVEYSGSWYECPRVLKLALFLVGGSSWPPAFVTHLMCYKCEIAEEARCIWACSVNSRRTLQTPQNVRQRVQSNAREINLVTLTERPKWQNDKNSL